MARFVVFERGEESGPDRLAKTRILRDGFHFWAFLFSPIWLLWNGLLIEAVIIFAAEFGLAALGEVTGYGFTASLLSLLVAIYIGLEGVTLKAASLRRRGWRESGVVEADNLADAEVRVGVDMAGEESSAPGPLSDTRPMLTWTQPRTGATPALGLLGYTGRA
ncbi:DUF2628 domain-containing protein [Pseudaminobacter sp. 19-2017]|uniref:DUF2628 domain-containing protein n=1 Tax=Pseudaminobacter soli (ex Zhang et al. 2022) TaxID=2831468 RepID=A0A942E2D2_9HYPH|nr:DUF2628 domain-containing protein [Pseudaminobacter soli]MBS3649751.1 DUF2628 domain-containing protein [Pseudaminobacter soli]